MVSWEISRVKEEWSASLRKQPSFSTPGPRACRLSKNPFPGPVSRKLWELFGPRKAKAKSRTLRIRAFYSHILNMNRGSLHTGSFWRIHFSVFRCRWTKNDFKGPKSFWGFRETAPPSFKCSLSFIRERRCTPGGQGFAAQCAIVLVMSSPNALPEKRCMTSQVWLQRNQVLTERTSWRSSSVSESARASRSKLKVGSRECSRATIIHSK